MIEVVHAGHRDQEPGQRYLRPLLVLCLTLCLALCLLPAAPCSVPAHGRHHLQYIQITVFTKEVTPRRKERGGREGGEGNVMRCRTVTYLWHALVLSALTRKRGVSWCQGAVTLTGLLVDSVSQLMYLFRTLCNTFFFFNPNSPWGVELATAISILNQS